MTNLLKQGSNVEVKEYLEKVGKLADWRKSRFVG
jgi:hypothetical protein